MSLQRHDPLKRKQSAEKSKPSSQDSKVEPNKRQQLEPNPAQTQPNTLPQHALQPLQLQTHPLLSQHFNLSPQKILELETQATNQLLAAAISKNLKSGERILRNLHDDRQYDQRIYDQIKQQFIEQQANDNLIQQVNQLNNHLEKGWQVQREKQVTTEKVNSLLAANILDLLKNHGNLPSNLTSLIFRFDEQNKEISTELDNREKEREKLRQKITNRLLTDLRLVRYAQQVQGFNFNQQLLGLYQQIPEHEIKQTQLQTQPQSQPLFQQPQPQLQFQPQLQQSLPLPSQQQPQRQAQQSQPNRLTENLSVSLLRGLATAGGRLNMPNPMTSPVLIDEQITNFSQTPLLLRINAYLFSKKRDFRDLISMEGHCHGISLCWLLMRDWHLNPAFKMMRKVIIAGELSQAVKIGEITEFLLKLIDLGQNPGKYSNNTVTQQDLAELIGAEKNAFSFRGNFTQHELEQELLKHIPQGNRPMITIQGFGIHKQTKKHEGHTLAIYTESAHFEFFDPNDEAGEEIYLSSIKEIAAQSWKQLSKIYESTSQFKFIVTAVNPIPKPTWLIELNWIFRDEKSLVELIIGAPVQEEKPPANSLITQNPSPKIRF